MESQNKSIITVETTIEAPVKKVWVYYTQPEHITKWNYVSDDWHCPSAENDLRVGGKYSARMEAKDLPDRQATTLFEKFDGKARVTTSFDAENENPVDMQRDGWQTILDNFKKHVEAK